MSKFLKGAILILAIFSLAACNQAEDTAEDETDSTEQQVEEESGEKENQEDEESIALAENFIEQLSQGQYEESTDKFDQTMSEQLGAAELQELWESLEVQMGEFIDYEYNKTETIDGGYQVILIHGVFNDADIMFQVTVNDNLEIAGFYI